MSSQPAVTEHALAAPIHRVTVLEDRAMVTRVATVPAARGQVRLIVPQVSPLLVDKSLRVVASTAKILDIRCVRAMAPWRAASPGTPDDPSAPADPSADPSAVAQATARAAAVTRAKLALEQARVTAAAARDDLGAHVKLRRAELAGLAAAAARGEVTAEVAARAAAELSARDDDARAAVARIAEADEQVTELEQAWRDAEQLAELAGKRAGAETAHLEIDCIVDGDAASASASDSRDAAGAPGELTLEYLVPAAAWRPFHRAHLTDDALTWEQGACIWQRTGEDWPAVTLALSAERASLGVEPPELEDDLLDVRARPSHVAVQAREQEIEHVGLGEGGGPSGPSGPSGAPTVMGIDDGGLGLVLAPPARCTIASDGRPHRVTLETAQSEVETALLVIPLRSPLCHVRARFTNRARTPILAGPVDLLRRSGFIGRADTDFISAGEKAELGFGSEPEVRAHREQHEDQEDSSILGGWTSKVVRVVIRLSNLGTTARHVLVCDRVPVSELEQVQITVAGPDAYLLDKTARSGEPRIPQITARTIDANGLVTWEIPLPARGRAAVTLEYKIKSQRGVTGL